MTKHNEIKVKRQQPMSWFAFNTMRVVMHIRKAFRDINEEIGFAGIKEGDIILDYGCGLGFNSIPAAEIVGRKGKVIALDINPLAITIVNRKARKRQLTNIRTIFPEELQGNLMNELFDIVFLHNTLPLVHNKLASLEEITQRLKQGGKLSYVSRTGSRLYGKNSISNTDLIKILENDFQLILIKENKGHLIFEKDEAVRRRCF